MTLTLNPQQMAAVNKVGAWFSKRPTEPFLLAGVAGSGKTTLAESALIKCGLEPESILLCAPTGKAARVLASKTGRETMTVHSAIYAVKKTQIDKLRAALTEQLDTQEVLNKKNSQTTEALAELESVNKSIADLEYEIKVALHESDGPSFSFSDKSAGAKIMLIDEASMLGQQTIDDLEKVPVPKMYIFDPFQLPPIKQKWGLEGVEPDVFLTQIMRQGEGSGVATAAGDIREGRELQSYGKEFRILPRGTITIEQYAQDYDLILTGTNALRQEINDKIRKYLGFPKEPMVGDKLVALSNNRETGINNGEILFITKIHGFYPSVKPRSVRMDLVDAYGTEYTRVQAYLPAFYNQSLSAGAPIGMMCFTYGYCLTVHKSQGSEAKKVCVLDSWKGDNYERWLYTAVTRASVSCDLIR
jgi:exodeoxyribonuclease V